MKNCPSCNALNEADALFCEECGSPFKKKCRQCNHENKIKAKFCVKCGFKFDTASNDSNTPKKSESSRHLTGEIELPLKAKKPANRNPADLTGEINLSKLKSSEKSSDLKASKRHPSDLTGEIEITKDISNTITKHDRIQVATILCLPLT